MRNNNNFRRDSDARAHVERNHGASRFWTAFGGRLIDAGFASAASMTVKAILSVSLWMAMADLAIGALALILLTLAGYVAFSRGDRD